MQTLSRMQFFELLNTLLHFLLLSHIFHLLKVMEPTLLNRLFFQHLLLLQQPFDFEQNLYTFPYPFFRLQYSTTCNHSIIYTCPYFYIVGTADNAGGAGNGNAGNGINAPVAAVPGTIAPILSFV